MSFMFLTLESGHKRAVRPDQMKRMKALLSGKVKPTPAESVFLKRIVAVKEFGNEQGRDVKRAETTIPVPEWWHL